MAQFADTIVALSSGRLPSGVAIIRISGPHTRFVVETITGSLGPARVARYASLRTANGELIDRCIAIFFECPNSFTGEDIAEFHVHGGRAVVAATLDVLCSFEGVRSAEAGEFTRRAFLNGKLDLTATEALSDLITAETETQRRQALVNSQGAQSTLYANWRKRIVKGRALIEAELDFADESDIPGSVSEQVWHDMQLLKNELQDHILGYRRSEIIRDGYNVVIVGSPNSGKSSLINALAKRDVAIVSDEAGTTRDLVDVTLDIEGIKVVVTDTAGIRDGAGKVEAIGIARALRRAETADLIILLVDPISNTVPDMPEFENVLVVASKADRYDSITLCPDIDHHISALTGSGISELLSLMGARAAGSVGDFGDVLPTRQRQVELLRGAISHLELALEPSDFGLELRAEDLRLAGVSLGRITGEIDVEDLLDVIFSEFCIGK